MTSPFVCSSTVLGLVPELLPGMWRAGRQKLPQPMVLQCCGGETYEKHAHPWGLKTNQDEPPNKAPERNKNKVQPPYCFKVARRPVPSLQTLQGFLKVAHKLVPSSQNHETPTRWLTSPGAPTKKPAFSRRRVPTRRSRKVHFSTAAVPPQARARFANACSERGKTPEE